MPKPSVALCRPKPMMSSSARLIWPAAAELPMASPSAKLWSPMPSAISRASWPAPLRQPGAAVAASASAGSGAGAVPPPGPPGHPAVEVHQPEQRAADAQDQDQPGPDRLAELVLLHRFLDRFEGVADHLHEQEQQHAHGGGVQQRAQARRWCTQPTEGQAEEDGQAGYGAEQGNLGCGHAGTLRKGCDDLDG